MKPGIFLRMFVFLVSKLEFEFGQVTIFVMAYIVHWHSGVSLLEIASVVRCYLEFYTKAVIESLQEELPGFQPI